MNAKPCIPPEVLAALEAAETRKEEALARLLEKLDGVENTDEFGTAMERLIDADKRVVDIIKRTR